MFICSMILSTAGWYLGEGSGVFTAFMLSTVAGGIGIYLGKRLAERWGG